MSNESPVERGIKFLNEVLSDLTEQAAVQAFEEDGAIRFQIDGQAESLESRSELVSALSLLTSRVLSNQGERYDCILDFGGRYQARSALLSELAKPLGDIAKSANRRIYVSDLSSAERKLVHHALVNDAEIVTRSDGRQRRRLIIEPVESTEE
ncbi:MAG: hypothetical protein ACPGQS_03840 [Bradymonadia bacterium]